MATVDVTQVDTEPGELPAMMAAWVLGLWLAYDVGWFASGWLQAKLALVVLMIGYHHACGSLLKKFELKRNTRSDTWYRWFNEVPVVFLVAIVVLVIVKPL